MIMWFIKQAGNVSFRRCQLQPSISPPFSILLGTRRPAATDSGKGSISVTSPPGVKSQTAGIPKSDITLLESQTTSSDGKTTSSAPSAYTPPANKEASFTPPPSSTTISSFSAPATNDTLSLSSERSFKEKRKRFLDRLQASWYETSGTSEILALKESVNEASLAFDQASAQVSMARRHLDDALRMWERTSGQHLQLLQRRESWTSEDAQTFADLVGKEIKARRALDKAREEVAMTEETLSKRQLEYMNRMRRRYHEEQIWQDQWRVLGTYGTWSLIVLNSCVFLASQFFLWRRENARMKAIEELVRENSAQTKRMSTIPVAMENKVITTPAATQSTTSQDRSEALAKKDDEEIDHEEKVLRGEEVELVQIEELEIVEPSSPETEHSWRQRLHLHWNKFQSTATGKWQQIQLGSQSKMEQLQSKTQTVFSAIPGLDEMPKSLSEVHVPSAILGASVTSAIILLAMMLFTPKNK